MQNVPLDDGAPYDAVAESSFDDTGAMKALARSPEYSAVLEDEPRFIDRASMGAVITEEHVLKDGDPCAAAVKVIRFAKREPAMSLDDFFRAFLDYGELVAAAPRVVRYAQCHARRAIYESGRTPAYDAFAMAWTERPDAASNAGCLVVAERVVL